MMFLYIYFLSTISYSVTLNLRLSRFYINPQFKFLFERNPFWLSAFLNDFLVSVRFTWPTTTNLWSFGRSLESILLSHYPLPPFDDSTHKFLIEYVVTLIGIILLGSLEKLKKLTSSISHLTIFRINFDSIIFYDLFLTLEIYDSSS